MSENLKRKAVILFLLSATISMTGCYQAHSDDDLRTVPVTNNPHNIPDSGKIANMPGLGY